mgnify:CR=1 FL=1
MNTGSHSKAFGELIQLMELEPLEVVAVGRGILAVADAAMYQAKRDGSVTAVAGRSQGERVGVPASTLTPWAPSTIR